MPVYTVTIPSTKDAYKYRPYVVKEEKALLVAQQSENIGVILDTIKDIIKECSQTPLDIDSLASFDIEYLFLMLRAKSVGEVVTLVFPCDVDHGKDNKKAKASVDVNVEQANVIFPENQKNKIELFGTVGIMMKYPSFETLKKLELIQTKAENSKEQQDMMYDIIIDCINYVYDADQVYPAKDVPKEELKDYIDNLTNAQFTDILAFFQSIPAVRIDVEYDCPVCQLHHKKYIEGLSSFF